MLSLRVCFEGGGSIGLSPFPVIVSNEGLQGSPTENLLIHPWWERGQPKIYLVKTYRENYLLYIFTMNQGFGNYIYIYPSRWWQLK